MHLDGPRYLASLVAFRVTTLFHLVQLALIRPALLHVRMAEIKFVNEGCLLHSYPEGQGSDLNETSGVFRLRLQHKGCEISSVADPQVNLSCPRNALRP